METIKELREICQSDMTGADTWQDKLVCRRFSIYISWLLLHTKISAMQTTWIFFFFGFIPGIAFASSKYLAGALLLQLWYIFDGVDGEIARYRKQASVTGAFFDNIIHYVIHPYIFICIGCGLYKEKGNSALLLFAVSAGVSIMLLSIVHDLKNSILFSVGKERKAEGKIKIESTNPTAYIKSIFSVLHKICTYPSIMNIITIAAVSELFLKIGIFRYIIIFYGTIIPLLFISKLFVTIAGRRLDNE